ncbi:hypothetical protein [Rhizobium sp. RU36D]|uniref:hypothetical protein n=1 Tax=Rhizobium sp. RU36D TaxID=1907415 RepID=UPI0009D83AA0|nr:hypothetical protein [Rhizobium sp. RU36D]SMD16685.1 hypothetical protein SAMN05880593_13028 [Rhizobium sp. RU36D]
MILEALNYAATWPLTSAANRPHIRYSVNLWSRAGRCAAAWREHEEMSRRAMLAAMAGLQQKRTAVVLGSGLLRDVPILELTLQFDTVVLVDLVHLASVRTWLAIKGLRNVRLIERDLSGLSDIAEGRDPDPLGFLRQVPYLDLVISANLLSQIGRGAKRRIDEMPQGAMPDDALPRLMQAHLDGLANLPAKACLVTDIAFSVVDRTGHVHETVDLMHDVTPPQASSSWQWPVAPLGEESRDYQIIHQVIAA